MDYEIGQQPCTHLQRMRTVTPHGDWANVHSCAFCYLTVSYCITCWCDHHEEGWDACLDATATESDRRSYRLIDRLVDVLGDH